MAREFSNSGDGGGGAPAAYQKPLIVNQVDTGDINALIDSWTQAPDGKHTVVVNSGLTASGSHPNQHGFFVIPLLDVFGVAIGAGEISSFNAYVEIVSGMVDLDKSVIYVGLVDGASMNNDNVWQRLSAFFGGSPRLLKSGYDGTIAAANPSGDSSVHTRMDLMTRGGPTAGTLRVLETTCKGYDAAKLPITSSESGIAGIALDLTAVPHVFIAAGAYTAPAQVTLEFYVRVEAYRLPGTLPP